MLPITNLDETRQRLARWRRSQEVDRWKQILGNLELQPPAVRSAPEGETDLCVMISRNEARLYWRGPGKEHFEPLKQNQTRLFFDEHGEVSAKFTPEAELIRSTLAGHVLYKTKFDLRYADDEFLGMLSRLMRIRMLDSRIVASDSQPSSRPAEPLRLELISAT